MSHFLKEELEIKGSMKAVVDGLKAMGFTDKAIVIEKGQRLRGYGGDLRKDTCDIRVKKEHLGSGSNDVGFKKLPNGKWELTESEYDKGRGNYSAKKNYGGALKFFKERFITSFNEVRLKREMKKLGIKGKVVRRKMNDKGTRVELKIQVA